MGGTRRYRVHSVHVPAGRKWHGDFCREGGVVTDIDVHVFPALGTTHERLPSPDGILDLHFAVTRTQPKD